MPFDETCRRRKPAVKAFFPWPGFFYLDQNLPNRLLGFQAERFCPLQVASQGPWTGRMIQFRWSGIVDPLSPIQIAPQQSDKYQGTQAYGRQYIRWPCAHGTPAAKAQPAVSPHPKRSQYKILHRLHPPLVSPMGVKQTGLASAFVADRGPFRSTAISTLMPEKHIRSKYQPILKT
jgi:hypothetical protein